MYLERSTMDECAAAVRRSGIVVIPFGALEEHGPHLPLSTDTMQMAAICAAVEAERDVCVAPPVHYGVCRSTEDHPGTVGLSPETFRGIVFDLLVGFHRQGFKAAVLVSGHAGRMHMMAMLEAGERFVKMFDGMRVFCLSEFDLMKRDLYDIIETPGDSHAGEIETSRMLHMAPALVKKSWERVPADRPRFAPGEVVRNKRPFWKSGVWGDPGKATAEKGRKTIALAASKIIALVDSIQKKEKTVSKRGKRKSRR